MLHEIVSNIGENIICLRLNAALKSTIVNLLLIIYMHGNLSISMFCVTSDNTLLVVINEIY